MVDSGEIGRAIPIEGIVERMRQDLADIIRAVGGELGRRELQLSGRAPAGIEVVIGRFGIAVLVPDARSASTND